MTEITILNGGAEYKYKVAQSYNWIFDNYMMGHTLAVSIVGTGCVLLVNPNTPIIIKELIDHE